MAPASAARRRRGLLRSTDGRRGTPRRPFSLWSARATPRGPACCIRVVRVSAGHHQHRSHRRFWAVGWLTSACLTTLLALPSSAPPATASPAPAETMSPAPLVTAAASADYSLTPSDIRRAYSLPRTGAAHQTIAIVSAYDDPSAEADLNAYTKRFGIPSCTVRQRLLSQAKPGRSGIAAAGAGSHRRRVPDGVLRRDRGRARGLPELLDHPGRGAVGVQVRPLERGRRSGQSRRHGGGHRLRGGPGSR